MLQFDISAFSLKSIENLIKCPFKLELEDGQVKCIEALNITILYNNKESDLNKIYSVINKNINSHLYMNRSETRSFIPNLIHNYRLLIDMTRMMATQSKYLLSLTPNEKNQLEINLNLFQIEAECNIRKITAILSLFS